MILLGMCMLGCHHWHRSLMIMNWAAAYKSGLSQLSRMLPAGSPPGENKLNSWNSSRSQGCHANEMRSNWTRSIFSVPMRRVPIGRVPMRRGYYIGR